MSRVLSTVILAAAAAVAAAKTAPTPAAVSATAGIDSATISGLGARNIGSATMSGRIAAIAGRAESDGGVTLYVGSASGGVWRSRDAGTTFQPIFDAATAQSIGAVALDPNDPKTVWVGTGESWMRNSVSIGDGIYVSHDGGDTWQHKGLPTSEHIVRILVSPADSNTVYVCVPGRLWSDSADRGVYRTTDGGTTWQQVLKGSNLSTGCSSLALDPANPKKLFAGLWDFRRKGWTFRSGGEGPDAPSGSALWTSADGGTSWSEMTAANTPGLPAKPWGRVEIVVAPSAPQIVYTFIESARSALFRSDDGGAHFDERDRSSSMVWRPFYFAHLIVDPSNPDRIYKPDMRLIASEDGGKSFAMVSGGTHADHHDVWIHPKNPKFVVTGDDGGLWISHDGANKWAKVDSLPVSQFYHVTVDNQDPYQVYGGLQDNSSWVGDSAYPGGITNGRWENLYGGDGFWVHPDPTDPTHYVYAEAQGGAIGRVDRHTLVQRDIQPKAGYHEKLRFNWNAPIALSPHDPKRLYLGAQFLFLTRDHGQSWTRLSPDLTTNDPQKQRQEESGGITVDNSAAEMHTTIYTIAESPAEAGVIWVGTDDGNVQLTRDDGKTWHNVIGAIHDLPAASWVSTVEAGQAPGVAYATFDRHTVGDFDPYLYVTHDYGSTWTRLTGTGSGVRGYAHVVREDPSDARVLYLGTEFGLWISVDAGAHWAAFKGGNFPAVAVRDLAIQRRDRDLVIATHGRGMWIIDDLEPLRALAHGPTDAFRFLPTRPVQQRLEGNGGWPEGDAKFRGANPPEGAEIAYYQPTRHVFGALKIEILDADGHVIDTVPAGKRKGINRVYWSMQTPPPRVPSAAQAAMAGSVGARVVPGRYTVRLTKNGEVHEQRLDIGLDARADYGAADRSEHYAAAMQVSAVFERMSTAVDRINAVRALVKARADTAPTSALKDALATYAESLDQQRRLIVATKEGGAITGEERLREHLDQVYGALLGYEGRPAQYLLDRIAVLDRELRDVEAALVRLLGPSLEELNQRFMHEGLAPIARASIDDEVTSQRAEAALRRALDRDEESEVAVATRTERD
jgi:Sortilin, neurotensin receptor 3,